MGKTVHGVHGFLVAIGIGALINIHHAIACNQRLHTSGDALLVVAESSTARGECLRRCRKVRWVTRIILPLIWRCRRTGTVGATRKKNASWVGPAQQRIRIRCDYTGSRVKYG